MSTNRNPAAILGRITVKGRLCLDTPLLIGEGASGEERGNRDIHVLRSKDGIPFIPGTSLAGALRSFVEDDHPGAAERIFGTSFAQHSGIRGEDMQSAVTLYDIELSDAKLGMRDGVGIDPVTGRAIDHLKYDYEIVESGASGTFYAEIVLRAAHEKDRERLTEVLYRLRDLLRGGFHVGALATKGFGRMHVADMSIDCYNFRTAEDVRAWLSPERGHAALHQEYGNEDLLDSPPAHSDFIIAADFALTGALIVRDREDANKKEGDDKNPDARMKRNAAEEYIIPGTSIKGALRHRAAYILHALDKEEGFAYDLLDSLMGSTAMRSRFVVEETIVDAKEHPQTRIRIDRFTGGTMDSALFSTAPVWRKRDGTRSVTLRFGVRRAADWEAGLCVLLLKDLWLGRTAIGGEKSVGRGTLEGLHAVIHDRGHRYELTQGQPFAADIRQIMQNYVTALHQMQTEEAGV